MEGDGVALILIIAIFTLGGVGIGVAVGQGSVQSTYDSSLASCEIHKDAMQKRYFEADSTMRFLAGWLRQTGRP